VNTRSTDLVDLTDLYLIWVNSSLVELLNLQEATTNPILIRGTQLVLAKYVDSSTECLTISISTRLMKAVISPSLFNLDRMRFNRLKKKLLTSTVKFTLNLWDLVVALWMVSPLIRILGALKIDS